MNAHLIALTDGGLADHIAELGARGAWLARERVEGADWAGSIEMAHIANRLDIEIAAAVAEHQYRETRR